MFKTLKFITTALALLCAMSTAQAANFTTKINAESQILTMVNVLTPPEGQQTQLVAQLQKAMQNELINQPGFISASIHNSLNSGHVVNYAQWKDQQSLEAFVVKLQAGKAPEMAKVFTMAKPDYHPYGVASIHQPTK